MLLPEKSVLRNLPSELNPQQSLFFDGIRYAIDMADIGFRRLESALWNKATQASCDSIPEHLIQASLFLDAWSFIDCTHRLRELFEQAPGISQKGPALQVFLRATEDIEQLRHVAQHLRREVSALAQNVDFIHGTISWVALTNAESREFKLCGVGSGKVRVNSSIPMVNPIGKQFVGRIDHITLECKKIAVSLSDAYRSIKKVADILEAQILSQLKPLSSAGSDLYICMLAKASAEPMP